MVMPITTLGRNDIKVSRVCLGTMTWGEQNSEAEAHTQLDAALDFGVNFIDTAEMYPVPPMASTYGETERCIGSWLKARNNRDKVVLATKVMSRSDDLTYVRDGDMRLDHKNITAALDASLDRLQTDYVDLYQLHWPDRKTNYFGQLGYRYPDNDDSVPIEESLQVLADLVKTGKVRHIGISNETPWGAMRFIQLAQIKGLPRAVSIQNPYNLLNRTFEVGLAEIAHREQLGLLAYSPLAFGTLSGKYLNGAKDSTQHRWHSPICIHAHLFPAPSLVQRPWHNYRPISTASILSWMMTSLRGSKRSINATPIPAHNFLLTS